MSTGERLPRLMRAINPAAIRLRARSAAPRSRAARVPVWALLREADYLRGLDALMRVQAGIGFLASLRLGHSCRNLSRNRCQPVGIPLSLMSHRSSPSRRTAALAWLHHVQTVVTHRSGANGGFISHGGAQEAYAGGTGRTVRLAPCLLMATTDLHPIGRIIRSDP